MARPPISAFLLAAFVVLGSGPVHGQSERDALTRYARPASLIELEDGRRINLDCRGSGGPVVLLEAGWGSTTLAWASIHDALAELTTTCAYDRAGLGFSDPPTAETSLSGIADDARAALQRAGHSGPFVLVGHSKGGVFIRQFAAGRPETVGGMVLLDPGGPERDRAFESIGGDEARQADAAVLRLLEGCAEDARSGALASAYQARPFCVAQPDPDWSADLQHADLAMQISPRYAEARLAEFRLDNDSLSPYARTPTALGDLPLVVLSSDDGVSRAIPPERRTQLIAARHATDAAVATLSTRGVHRVVADSGHMISDDQPGAVIEAVSQVVASVRTGTGPD